MLGGRVWFRWLAGWLDRHSAFGMLPVTTLAGNKAGADCSSRMATQFFLIFVVTIAATRIGLYLYPIPGPTIGDIRIHHYVYGVLLTIVGLVTKSMPVYAVGIGLFVDELTYVMMGGKTHQDNYSRISLLGTLLFVVVVFALRSYFARPFDSRRVAPAPRRLTVHEPRN